MAQNQMPTESVSKKWFFANCFKKIFFSFDFQYNTHRYFFIIVYMQDTARSLIWEFWKWLGIIIQDIQIVIIDNEINISIQTPDSALIIGIHGKSLESFSHILSRMIQWATWSYVHVHLEVNDYIKLKDEKFYKLLDDKIASTLSTGKAHRIPHLKPYDRKKAHNYIAQKNIPTLKAYSEWEDDHRVLVLEYTGEPIDTMNSTEKKSIHVSSASIHSLTEDGTGI